MSTTLARKPSMKIILIGNSGTGKTSLISAFFNLSYDANTAPTVAPSYSSHDMKTSKGTIVSLQIWDTAGQERYHSVSQLFFRGSDIAFVCMDVSDTHSIDSVADWIRRARDESPECTIFLVMTKCDLKSRSDIGILKKEISDRFSVFNINEVFITSAQAGEGVSELFTASAELYHMKKSRLSSQSELERGNHDERCAC